MKERFNYSFLICLAGLLSLFVCTGLACNNMAVFMPFILKEYGITNTQISSMLLTRSITSFIGLSIAKRYYKVLSLRTGMFVAALLAAASSVCYGLTRSYPGLLFGAVLAGCGYSLGATLPVSMLLNRWFKTYRNLALSICAMGTTLAVIGIPSLMTSIIQNRGLTAAFLTQSVIMASIALLCFLIIRNDPESCGKKAFDRAERVYDDTKNASGGTQSAKRTREHYSMERSDWFIMLPVLLLLGAVANPGYNHLTVFFNSEGFSPAAIAIALSFSGIAGCAGKLVFGTLADKVSVFFCNYVYGIMMVAGLLILCIFRSDAALYIGNSMFVAGVGIAVVGPAAWAGDLCGDDFDPVVQRFQQTYTFGAILFNLFPGITADLCGGSYLLAFYVFTIFCVLITVGVQYVYIRKRRAARIGG